MPPVSHTAGPAAADARVGDGPWTIDRIHALGATTDLRTAAAIFGLSRNTAYDLARRSEFPVAVLRVGARYRVPVPAILAVLGGCAACTRPAATIRRPRSGYSDLTGDRVPRVDAIDKPLPTTPHPSIPLCDRETHD